MDFRIEAFEKLKNDLMFACPLGFFDLDEDGFDRVEVDEGVES